MAHNTLIDNVFSKQFKHARKPSAQEILGIKMNSDKGHSRFYSRQFVPFAAERDVRGKLITNALETSYNQKHSTLWQLSQDITGNKTRLSEECQKAQKSLIDARFKLHEVDHFRERQTKSHMRSVPEFEKEFEGIQNRGYKRKCKQAKLQEQLWLTTGFRSIQLPTSNHDPADHSSTIFTTTLNGHSLPKHPRPKLSQSLSLTKLKPTSQGHLSQLKPLHKSLFNKKPSRNPQLQEIERHVRVHFNHPELDRLKQSKKLQFRIVENLDSGDRKFKEKIEEYRRIKERIKKEMGKH